MEGLQAFRGKLAIAMPLGKVGPVPLTFEDWTTMALMTEHVIGEVLFIPQHGMPTVANREAIASTFMRTDREWLAWIDSDMRFLPDVLCRMLALVQQMPEILVLSGTARMSGGDPRSVCYLLKDGRYENIEKAPADVFTVNAVGTFGMLMHRSVFERCERPWFSYGVPGYGSDDAINFCKRLNAAGIDIWVDARLPFGHIDSYVISGDLRE